MRSIHHAVATFFGAGLAPKAPGTVGSLASIPLYLIIRRLSLPGYLAVVAVLTAVGVKAADVAEQDWGKDPGKVVIDEVVGMLLTLLERPAGWPAIAAAFLIFRILDIVKPPPVGNLDKGLSGGIGIMADDAAAGFIGAAVLGIVKRLGRLR